MSDGSTIEWLQRPGTKPATWNPIRAGVDDESPVGWHCEHVHEGCRHCYAERMNVDRFGTGLPYARQSRDRVKVFLDDRILLQPLKWKSPRTIFVCSMSDLYGEWVTDEWLDKIKAVQALTPRHTYIELTKRPARMRDYSLARATKDTRFPVIAAVTELQPSRADLNREVNEALDAAYRIVAWPLPNVWGLVSCSIQEDADKFIPILLQTPLAVRGASLEPLLGPIDLYNGDPDPRLGGHKATETFIGDWWPAGAPKGTPSTHGLDWVIAGGESGAGARPVHPDWIRSLRDQCDAAEVAFFFKQWGEAKPVNGLQGAIDLGKRSCAIDIHGKLPGSADDPDAALAALTARPGAYQFMSFVGKKAAGRLLDGVTHDGYPQGSPA